MLYNSAELNQEMSAAVQAEAEKKLGRSLTADEEYCIWNHGSFMGLEAIDRAIYYAKSPVEVEKYLAELPKREPLSDKDTQRT